MTSTSYFSSQTVGTTTNSIGQPQWVVDYYRTTLVAGSAGLSTVTTITTELWNPRLDASKSSTSSSSSTTNSATKTSSETPLSSPTTSSPVTVLSTSGSSSFPTHSTSSTSSAVGGSSGNTIHASSGVSNGAVVGIAIGLLVAGLILGLIAGLFFAKRRKARPSPEYSAFAAGEKDLDSSSAADKLQLDQFLLDSKPDGSISGELQSLSHLIQQHVETHYHAGPVSVNKSSLVDALAFLGIAQDNSVDVAACLIEPKTRFGAIRHVISKAAFESTTIHGACPVSLLPPGVAAMTSAIPPAESHTGNHRANETALIRWRQLSAFLLHANRSDRTPLALSEDMSTTQANDLAVALNRCLGPFVAGDREERYEQENHLREVIVECATFGYLLFSQPAEYRFQFYPGGGAHALVVSPGLYKVADEEGRPFRAPLPQITAPMIEAI